MDDKTILIIEDDVYTRDLYSQVLKDAGFLITTAGDGVEGLSFIQKGGFDLILLDAMMPKMDGLTVLTRLKTLEIQQKNGPIILCTNLAGDAVIDQAMAAGAKGCIIKTDLNPDQIIEKVKSFLTV